jgi:mRNA interferase MazF
MVAPMTTGSRPAKFRVPVAFAGKTGLILVDQVRTVDKQRLVKRQGEVTMVTLARTLETLRKTFED